MEIELFLNARATIGESLAWVPQENALYWADIKAPALHRTLIETRETKTWRLPADIGAFALGAGNRALVALRTGLYWLNLATGDLTLQTPAPFNPNLIRFNEGACDSTGRFWVGTMTDPLDGADSNEPGLLYSFTTAGGLVPHDEPSLLLNGMAWSAGEELFYLSHSYEKLIFTFAYDRQTGTLGPRKTFANLGEERGIPDGAAVDAAGGYWCAIHDGGRLHRYTEDGALDLVVDMPVSQPTTCCFAGDDLATLYVTSAREKLDSAQLRDEPYAGGLFRLRPAVPGLPRSCHVR